MITVLSANFALVTATQTEFWCNLNYQIEQKQIRASATQNIISWCQQCNKPGTVGKTECDLLKGYKLRTNYVKNTTSVSSCDVEQVAPTKCPNQYTIRMREIMLTLHVSCFIIIDDNKTRMKWHKILVCNVMTLSKQLKYAELSGKLSWTEL